MFAARRFFEAYREYVEKKQQRGGREAVRCILKLRVVRAPGALLHVWTVHGDLYAFYPGYVFCTAVIVDMLVRLVGSWSHVENFLDKAREQTHGCNYLLAKAMEMAAPEDYASTS